MSKGMKYGWQLVALPMLWMAQAAQAHGGPGHEHGIVAALLHPFQYWDHFLALVTVCLLLCAALWLGRSMRRTTRRVLLQLGSVSIALASIALLS